jgi:AraC-like DNA-binding protein
MSASSFHKQFRTVTSTTPLQYQKELRLLEARRLLMTEGGSVTAVAYEVGYESTSQFSREYARKFGAPPSQERAAANGLSARAPSRHRGAPGRDRDARS